MLYLFVGAPAVADPVPPTVPDEGARPSGQFLFPGGTPGTTQTPSTTAVSGPLGQKVMQESAAVETLGQQLLQVDEELKESRETVTTTEKAWKAAARELSDLRDKANHAAGEAYKAATALGPLDQYASEVHQLSVLMPGGAPVPGGQAAARDLERAQQAEQTARLAFQSATASADALAARHKQLKTSYDQRAAALKELRSRNDTQRELAALEAQKLRENADLNIGAAVDGMVANPKALKAVEFALKQRGKLYEWGAAGPHKYDCSGLMLAAYLSVGHKLPRVANQQYKSTAGKTVPFNKLLPGDMVYFATNKADWTSIHHVGMYVGGGQMVHAPNFNEVVKVSAVGSGGLFAATRVFDAVKAPDPAPQPKPDPPSSPPSTPPSTSPSPSKPPSSSSPPPSPEPSNPSSSTRPWDQN